MLVLRYEGQDFRKSTFSGGNSGSCVYLNADGVLDSKAMMVLPGKVNITKLVQAIKAS